MQSILRQTKQGLLSSGTVEDSPERPWNEFLQHEYHIEFQLENFEPSPKATIPLINSTYCLSNWKEQYNYTVNCSLHKALEIVNPADWLFKQHGSAVMGMRSIYVARGACHNEEGSGVKVCHSTRLLVLTGQAWAHVRGKVRNYCCYIIKLQKTKAWEWSQSWTDANMRTQLQHL